MSEDELKAIEEFRLSEWARVTTVYGLDGRRAKAERIIDALLAEVRRLNTENERLRKTLAHVPARVAIKAKEAAGFPEFIHTQGANHVQSRTTSDAADDATQRPP